MAKDVHIVLEKEFQKDLTIYKRLIQL